MPVEIAIQQIVRAINNLKDEADIHKVRAVLVEQFPLVL